MPTNQSSPHQPSSGDDLPPASRAEVDAFARLIGLIRRLRGPEGCAWDRQQTLQTMTPYIIEETYEVVDAIERDSDDDLREELGDLVFLLFFCLEIAREDSRCRLEEALENHISKMIARHPHVFGDTAELGTKAASLQWEEIKQRERSTDSSVLDGRLPGLPALTGAFRVQEKASAVGFDWERIEDVLDKVEEELGELRAEIRANSSPATGAHDRRQAELGDLIFALVNVGRFLAIDPEAALRGTTNRFISRFRHIEDRLRQQERRPADASLAEMDALWEEAKRREQEAPDG